MVEAGSSRSRSDRPFLNTAEAAHYLGIGWRKLMRLRLAGEGPKVRKHGRLILYHRDDLDIWSRATSGDI